MSSMGGSACKISDDVCNSLTAMHADTGLLCMTVLDGWIKR